MSRSTDQDKQHQEEWEENRFKNFSKEELDRIKSQDEEREANQALIDETVEKCVKAYPDLVSTAEKNKQIEEAKKKREEERWREFHYFKD